MHALTDYIRYYDNALPTEFCRQLVAGFEQMSGSQLVNGKGVRPGLESSRWTELNMSRYADSAMKEFFADSTVRPDRGSGDEALLRQSGRWLPAPF